MSSHQYANRLKGLADFLLSKPEFDPNSNPRILLGFWEKEQFLKAAKALGSVTKKYAGGDLEIYPVDFPELCLYISRNVVCRKVQDEKWECEPLLSQAEEAEIKS